MARHASLGMMSLVDRQPSAPKTPSGIVEKCGEAAAQASVVTLT